MGNVSLEVKSIFKPDIFQTSHTPNTYQPGNKRNVSCFYCGKPGHVSRECRTRLASEKSMTTVKSHEVSVVPKSGVKPDGEEANSLLLVVQISSVPQQTTTKCEKNSNPH